MKKQLVIAFCVLYALTISGCDTGTGNTQIQDIGEVQWQSDGSAIYGFIQSYVLTLNATQSATAYSLARFNPSDGSLAQTFNTGVFSRPSDPITGDNESYSPSVYLSSDGSTIVTQLENDLYRYNTKTNLLEKLQTLLHLIVVSPDLHYAVGTSSPGIFPIKTISIYDITSSPIRLVKNFDVTNLEVEPGAWLNNETFGLSIKDSVGSHVSIYDTTGTIKGTIGGTSLSFHNFAFFKQTNHLFLTKSSGSSSPVNFSVEKVDLGNMTSTNILNIAVENFALTSDENTIIYSAFDSTVATTKGISVRIRNLTSLKEGPAPLATDIKFIISLSPIADRLAYVAGDVNFNQIRIIPFTRP